METPLPVSANTGVWPIDLDEFQILQVRSVEGALRFRVELDLSGDVHRSPRRLRGSALLEAREEVLRQHFPKDRSRPLLPLRSKGLREVEIVCRGLAFLPGFP